MSCLPLYADRFEPFLSDMRLEVEEFLATGSVRRARELSAATGQRFNDARLPQFFGGDLDAEVVLVHLNAKSSDEVPAWHAPVKTFQDYFDAHRHFGARMYGPDSPRTHRSPFDHKQVRFLRPLDVIDFVGDEVRAPGSPTWSAPSTTSSNWSWSRTARPPSRRVASPVRSSNRSSSDCCPWSS
jgi:hypothetical protein